MQKRTTSGTGSGAPFGSVQNGFSAALGAKPFVPQGTTSASSRAAEGHSRVSGMHRCLLKPGCSSSDLLPQSSFLACSKEYLLFVTDLLLQYF